MMRDGSRMAHRVLSEIVPSVDPLASPTGLLGRQMYVGSRCFKGASEQSSRPFAGMLQTRLGLSRLTCLFWFPRSLDPRFTLSSQRIFIGGRVRGSYNALVSPYKVPANS